MKTRILYILSLIMILSTAVSCSDYYHLTKEKSTATNEEKKEAALEYFEAGEYLKTITLIDQVRNYYRLTTDWKELYFKYCMSYFKLKDYYLAGYYFKGYVRQFPTAIDAEDAMFYSALCSVYNSPDYSLDQTETYNALDLLQIFVDEYPESERIEQCNQIMDDLRAKLEKKQFEYAKLYYHTENYKSAVVALQQTLDKYPESAYEEEIRYLLVLSNFELAINSIDKKKLERLNNTLKSYRTFVAEFPESPKVAELANIKKQTDEAIAEIKAKIKIEEENKG